MRIRLNDGWAAMLTLAACTLVPLVGCTGSEVETEEVSAEPASAASRWSRVEEPSDLSLIEAPARLLAPPGTSGAVSLTFRAQLAEVHVQAGDRVEAGAPIVDVIAPDIVAAAAAYRAAARRVESFQSRLTQLESLMEEGIVERSRVFEVSTLLAEARSARDESSGMLQAAGLSPGSLRSRLRGNRLTLVSPVAGVVRSVPGTIGEVFEGGATPLATIVGEGSPRVEARFSGRLASDLRFEFVAPSGERHALRRVPDGSLVLPDDGTTLEWFEFEDASVRLPSGLSGRVRALGGANVLQIPSGALRGRGEGAVIFVRDGDTRREVTVQVLASAGTSALVSSDSLQVGDEVVADIASVLASEASSD